MRFLVPAGASLLASICVVVGSQLPPAILLDGYLLRAEQAVRDEDRAGALRAMGQIAALQEEHDLETEPEYHYRYSAVWNALGSWERSRAAAILYLQETGRDGEYYREALELMNRATVSLEAAERDRARRAAAQAREQAARDAAKAEAERRTAAARELTRQMEFVRLPAGEFRMMPANSYARRGQGSVWVPAHSRRRDVRITRPFEIGRYEVTVSQWDPVMGSDTRAERLCSRCPASYVSWDDAQRFASMLTEASDGAHRYRLPTEAEWEYAARAGDNSERFGRRNLEESAWFRDNGGRSGPHPVGLKQPNGFGLHDMIGNVEEWTADAYYLYEGGGRRVDDPRAPPTSNRERITTRGCDYNSTREVCEIAWRFPTRRPDLGVGFRLVRTGPSTQ